MITAFLFNPPAQQVQNLGQLHNIRFYAPRVKYKALGVLRKTVTPPTVRCELFATVRYTLYNNVIKKDR